MSLRTLGLAWGEVSDVERRGHLFQLLQAAASQSGKPPRPSDTQCANGVHRAVLRLSMATYTAATCTAPKAAGALPSRITRPNQTAAFPARVPLTFPLHTPVGK
eukprot:GFKZ01011719.1.p1 GENE.GFKZ01011719.1~~GFKZ01011719.1.p1  ORF type:complete len:104 (-),score=3.59 GFKZ01011719.1:267-578(-)